MLKRILSLLMVMAMMLSLVAVAAAVESEQEPAQAQAEGETVETKNETEQEAEAEAEEEVEAEREAEAEPETEAEPVEAVVSFYVNEQPVYDAQMYELNGVVYAPVRPFFEAALPGCEIRWEDGQALIEGETAAGETLSVAARPGTCYVQANGRCLYAADNIQLIKSTTMIPLPLLTQLFRGAVSTDEAGIPHVTLGESLLASGEDRYDKDWLELLSRLIFAESGNQSMLGKIAVGNVVLNRVRNPLFPDTLYHVIYQSNQFSVVNDGSINKTPSEEAVIAAKLCLEGAKVTDALFFNVRGLRCWAALNRPYVTTIGNHDFYA